MRYFFFVLLTLRVFGLYAQTPSPPEKPALIVHLVVDNLSLSEIEQNSHLLSDKGLLKLKTEGLDFTNATFPYVSSGKAADYASLSTGTTPRHHGIVAEQWYLSAEDRLESCVESKTAVLIGDYRQNKGSDAKKMIAPSLADQLKRNTLDKAKIFSIAFDKEAAILLGGHAADGAFWVFDKSGKWVTSDYYMSWLPDWVNNHNNEYRGDSYLAQKWGLSMNALLYNVDNETYSKENFPIVPKNYADEKSPYKILSSTPMGNTLVLDFATQLIEKEAMGDDQITDLLYLNVSSITDKGLNKSPYSFEKVDHLLRLDKEIARLIEVLDNKIGRHRYLLVINGVCPQGVAVKELEKRRIPSGRFSPERALALLNAYFMALHGQGNWILNISNRQIFLNKTLIEKSQLNFRDFQEKTAAFMEEFEGIKWAIPSHRFKHTDFNNTHLKNLQEAYFSNRCGDVMMSYYPGWAEEEEGNTLCYTSNYEGSALPLVFFGWKIEAGKVETPTHLTDVAASLAAVLNLPPPSSFSNTLLKNAN